MKLEPGMIMDLLTAAILLLSLLQGIHSGFAKALSSFVQWFGSILAGFFLHGSVKAYIIEHTELEEQLNSYILKQITTTIEESTPYQSMPDLFRTWVNNSDQDFVYGTSAALTNVILTVCAFLAIVLAIKLVCWIFVLLFSKDHHDGVIGCLDRLLGLLFGAARGLLLVFLVFAVLVPLLSLLPPEISTVIKEATDHSCVASVLYDDNLLLILMRDLFSS